MGLLDDAIREHLDLKRRRGDDPAEIERLEREALGPVRREPSAFAEETPPRSDESPVDEDDYVAQAERDADPTGGSEDGLEHAEGDPLDAPTMLLETHELPSERGGTEREDRAGGPGMAAPDYADPDFDEFSAAAAPLTGDPQLEPSAPVLHPEVALDDAPPEPRQKRRGLLGRLTHHDRHAAVEPDPDDAFGADDDFLPDGGPGPARRSAGEEPGGNRTVTPPPPALQISSDAEHGHTVEYDVEHALDQEDTAASRRRGSGRLEGAGAGGASAADGGAGAGAGGEDILEETPDFLADTPDHDRLWFEQKPPPDFDFER